MRGYQMESLNCYQHHREMKLWNSSLARAKSRCGMTLPNVGDATYTLCAQ